MSVQAAFAEVARQDGRAALVTVLRGSHAGARMLVRADGGREGSLGDAELEAQAIADADELMWSEKSEMRGDLFVDVTCPPPRVLIFGAVEYAGHLADMAHMLGWRAAVIDPRARFATRERFPEPTQLVVAWPAPALEELGGIDRATYFAILSNDPKLDDEVLTLALAGEPAYIGAMGSTHAQVERRDRLIAAGIAEEELSRISAPVGLDLGALGAAETALSIMSELIAVRYGRTGERLSARK